jgi:hypothetical protein
MSALIERMQGMKRVLKEKFMSELQSSSYTEEDPVDPDFQG